MLVSWKFLRTILSSGEVFAGRTLTEASKIHPALIKVALLALLARQPSLLQSSITWVPLSARLTPSSWLMLLSTRRKRLLPLWEESLRSHKTKVKMLRNLKRRRPGSEGQVLALVDSCLFLPAPCCQSEGSLAEDFDHLLFLFAVMLRLVYFPRPSCFFLLVLMLIMCYCYLLLLFL